MWNRLTTSPSTTAKRPSGRSAGCGRQQSETRSSSWPSWCCAGTSEPGRRAPHSGSYTSAGPCCETDARASEIRESHLHCCHCMLYRTVISVDLCVRCFTDTEGTTPWNHCNSRCSTDGGATVTCGSVTDARWNIRPHYERPNVFDVEDALVNVLFYQVLNNNQGLKPHYLLKLNKVFFK